MKQGEGGFPCQGKAPVSPTYVVKGGLSRDGWLTEFDHGGGFFSQVSFIVHVGFPIEFIYVWYIYLHEWLMFMVNVGKYTVRPIDPMGLENALPKMDRPDHFGNLVHEISSNSTSIMVLNWRVAQAVVLNHQSV